MLKNDPPPGTAVTLLTRVQKAEPYSTAKLVRALQKYQTDRPEDLFEIEYAGERMIVKRSDIQ